MKKNTQPSAKLKITAKQKEILLLLYKFRFLTTTHLQKLFNHKDPHRIKEWLLDLLEKDCVRRNYERKSFGDSTKPAVYYLAPKARLILKKEKELNFSELEYIYQEKRRTKKFINHCLFLVDVYLYLFSQKGVNEELKFFTKTDLQGYEYFPDPLPDAFISRKREDADNYYFLDVFDDFTPPFVFRKRVRMYLDYAEESKWEENTDLVTLPTVLFILPNESLQKHVLKYAQALLEKDYEDKLTLFLTTEVRIKFGEMDNIWQKV